AAAAAAAAAARREAWHQTQKFKVEQHTEELEIDEDEVVMALDRAEAARAARERELELEHELDRPQSDLTPRVERSDLSSLFDAPVAARLPRDDDDDATGEHQAVGVAHADTLPANRSAAAASIAATESFRENAARTLLNMPAAVDDDVAAAAADDDDDDDDKTPRPTTGVDVLEPVLETIMHDLFGAVGVLSSMLEERIDPGGALSREYARISRLVARQCGMTDLEISRVALAAHLCGLDVALRSELGAPGAARVADVASIFAAKPSTPGGLNPTLRSVGARALGLDASASPGDDHDPRDLPFAAQLVSTVSDYIELRAESEEQGGDMETVLQLMRASGADPELLDVLQRAVETEHEATQTSRTPPTRHEQ
ncbi:MAG: hypothetical protein KC503_47235, partial [Myxococcales bacterium]|nr:hypothetical protein [Myxococcales bacterium]